MAAGGFRTFVAGETLDEDKINDFLMQGILVFDDSTARGSAIASPVHGQVSFLKDSNSTEFYDGSSWTELSAGIDMEFVVIAGGAGGATSFSGGGGAGGYISTVVGESTGGGGSAIPFVTEAATLAITVGAGGAPSVQGNPSHLGDFLAAPGGRAGPGGENGFPGGSGGGAGGSGGTTIEGFAFRRQGNNGGDNFPQGGVGPAGGGGGAGAVGETASSSKGGNGGAGLSSSITGSAVTRGGGGGGSTISGTPGSGGAGGGGAASLSGSGTAGSGTANTGGGGGSGNNPGSGGSGVVIFRVPIGTSVTFSGGVTETSGNTGTWTHYTVTAAGPTDTVTIG